MESLSDEELLHEIDVVTAYNKEWETHNNKLSKEVDEFGSSGRKRPVEEGCVFQGDSYGRVSSGCDFNSGIEAFSTFINIY